MHLQLRWFIHKPISHQYQFRHTVSYWISISFIFGSLLFTTGSAFWIIDDYITTEDYYALVTVAYFAGACAFGTGSYFGYHEVINELQKKHKPQKRVHKRLWLFLSGRKSMHYWTALVFFMGTILYQITVTFDVMKVEFEM